MIPKSVRTDINFWHILSEMNFRLLKNKVLQKLSKNKQIIRSREEVITKSQGVSHKI